MIEVKVHNPDGQAVGAIEVDPAWFGGEVRMDLLRLAVRRFEAHQRVGTAATKSRGQIAYSTKKLFRQKGTGRARMGPRANPVRRGGGNAFAKRSRAFTVGMSRQARRQALDSALLARLTDGEVLVLEGLALETPRTKTVASALKACGADRSCLFAVPVGDTVLYRSARNLPRMRVRPVCDLNAYEVLWPNRVVFTREAFDAMLEARKG